MVRLRDPTTMVGFSHAAEVAHLITLRLGLELARLADLPADVLVEGKRVAINLAQLHARHEEDSESSKIAMRRKALLRVCGWLARLPLS